ncbi:MAG TPA: hypothetical protein VM165_09405 [Planctomycetaceae bacterium]|nr:hypothetical protein [Planctomycetaceae bacterium]
MAHPHLRHFGFWLIGLLLAATAVADEPAELSSAARRERLSRLRTHLLKFQPELTAPDGAVAVTMLNEPSLLYADNARELSDASLWIWEHEGRPVAPSAIEFRRKDGDAGVWSFEFAVLSPRAMQVVLPNRQWSIVESGTVTPKIANGPQAAATRGERLLQMRRLADRFAAGSVSKVQGRLELRRLASPIYRQPETASGDGAVFVFANGTNPEVLLWLQTADMKQWTYRLPPVAGDALAVRLDDREVWTAPTYAGPGSRTNYSNGRLMTQEQFEQRVP